MGSYLSRGASEPVDMNGPLAQEIQNLIKEHDVVIISKQLCPYCVKAREVFKTLNQPYHEVDVGQRNDGPAIQDLMLEMTGARSVPRVFVKGEFIGGGSDTQALFKSQELQKKLNM